MNEEDRQIEKFAERVAKETAKILQTKPNDPAAKKEVADYSHYSVNDVTGLRNEMEKH